VTGGIVLAGSAAQLVNYGFALDVPALESSRDGGAFGVIGDIALASAALAAWIVLARARVRHAAIVALPVLLTFLAFDKALRLHDEIPHWPQYYVPILLATFATLVLVGRGLSAQCRQLMLVPLALLGMSFLIHLTGESVLDKLGLAGDGWARQLKAVIKHGAEVAGWLLVTLALLTATRGGRSLGRRARLAMSDVSSVTDQRLRLHRRIQARVVTEISQMIEHFAGGRGRLLDVDPGTGLQTIVFRDHLAHAETPWVYAQHDRREHDVARQTEFAAVDLEASRFPADDESFDVVVWNRELVTLKNLTGPLAEVQRILRPGGLFIIALPNLASLHNRLLVLGGLQPTTLHIANGNHVRGFAIRSMTRFLREKYGPGLLRVTGVGLPPFASGVVPPPLRDLSHTAIWALQKR
jgi:ubiquinone/menaquinone biosynthesis C-methylase UbiE